MAPIQESFSLWDDDDWDNNSEGSTDTLDGLEQLPVLPAHPSQARPPLPEVHEEEAADTAPKKAGAAAAQVPAAQAKAPQGGKGGSAAKPEVTTGGVQFVPQSEASKEKPAAVPGAQGAAKAPKQPLASQAASQGQAAQGKGGKSAANPATPLSSNAVAQQAAALGLSHTAQGPQQPPPAPGSKQGPAPQGMGQPAAKQATSTPALSNAVEEQAAALGFPHGVSGQGAGGQVKQATAMPAASNPVAQQAAALGLSHAVQDPEQGAGGQAKQAAAASAASNHVAQQAAALGLSHSVSGQVRKPTPPTAPAAPSANAQAESDWLSSSGAAPQSGAGEKAKQPTATASASDSLAQQVAALGLSTGPQGLPQVAGGQAKQPPSSASAQAAQAAALGLAHSMQGPQQPLQPSSQGSQMQAPQAEGVQAASKQPTAAPPSSQGKQASVQKPPSSTPQQPPSGASQRQAEAIQPAAAPKPPPSNQHAAAPGPPASQGHQVEVAGAQGDVITPQHPPSGASHSSQRQAAAKPAGPPSQGNRAAAPSAGGVGAQQGQPSAASRDPEGTPMTEIDVLQHADGKRPMPTCWSVFKDTFAFKKKHKMEHSTDMAGSDPAGVGGAANALRRQDSAPPLAAGVDGAADALRRQDSAPPLAAGVDGAANALRRQDSAPKGLEISNFARDVKLQSSQSQTPELFEPTPLEDESSEGENADLATPRSIGPAVAGYVAPYRDRSGSAKEAPRPPPRSRSASPEPSPRGSSKTSHNSNCSNVEAPQRKATSRAVSVASRRDSEKSDEDLQMPDSQRQPWGSKFTHLIWSTREAKRPPAERRKGKPAPLEPGSSETRALLPPPNPQTPHETPTSVEPRTGSAAPSWCSEYAPWVPDMADDERPDAHYRKAPPRPVHAAMAVISSDFVLGGGGAPPRSNASVSPLLNPLAFNMSPHKAVVQTPRSLWAPTSRGYLQADLARRNSAGDEATPLAADYNSKDLAERKLYGASIPGATAGQQPMSGRDAQSKSAAQKGENLIRSIVSRLSARGPSSRADGPEAGGPRDTSGHQGQVRMQQHQQNGYTPLVPQDYQQANGHHINGRGQNYSAHQWPSRSIAPPRRYNENGHVPSQRYSHQGSNLIEPPPRQSLGQGHHQPMPYGIHMPPTASMQRARFDHPMQLTAVRM